MSVTIFISYTSTYTLILQIIGTTNYRDVFIVFEVLSGGVWKSEIQIDQIHQLSWRFHDCVCSPIYKLSWRFLQQDTTNYQRHFDPPYMICQGGGSFWQHRIYQSRELYIIMSFRPEFPQGRSPCFEEIWATWSNLVKNPPTAPVGVVVQNI